MTYPPNTIRVSKSERVIWAGISAVRKRDGKCIPGNLKERDYTEGLGIDGKTNIQIDLIYVESSQ